MLHCSGGGSCITGNSATEWMWFSRRALREQVRTLLEEMHDLYRAGYTPRSSEAVPAMPAR